MKGDFAQNTAKCSLFLLTTQPTFLWGIPPRPNPSFSLAQRKEVKETSTPSKSSPIWEDYRIIASPLLSRCFCKAGRRLIFFLWLALIDNWQFCMTFAFEMQKNGKRFGSLRK